MAGSENARFIRFILVIQSPADMAPTSVYPTSTLTFLTLNIAIHISI